MLNNVQHIYNLQGSGARCMCLKRMWRDGLSCQEIVLIVAIGPSAIQRPMTRFSILGASPKWLFHQPPRRFLGVLLPWQLALHLAATASEPHRQHGQSISHGILWHSSWMFSTCFNDHCCSICSTMNEILSSSSFTLDSLNYTWSWQCSFELLLLDSFAWLFIWGSSSNTEAGVAVQMKIMQLYSVELHFFLSNESLEPEKVFADRPQSSVS